jgi:hypothetical protein
MNQPMTPFAANPFVFIFSGLILVAVIGYFAWGALDRLGLADEQASAVVTGKNYYPPGMTYRTNIVAGRAWTQSSPTSDAYVLLLNLGQEPTGAIVSRELYDAVRPGDGVQVRMRRTRLSRRLEVTDVVR